MLDSNPFLIDKLNSMRNAELVEKARIERLIAESKPKNSGVISRLLTASGRLLIHVGQRLQARFEFQPVPEQVLTRSNSKS